MKQLLFGMLLLMPCVAIAATDNNISSSQITDVVEQRPHGKATDSNIFGHVLVSATGELFPTLRLSLRVQPMAVLPMARDTTT